jgi:hypothetical protein
MDHPDRCGNCSGKVIGKAKPPRRWHSVQVDESLYDGKKNVCFVNPDNQIVNETWEQETELWQLFTNHDRNFPDRRQAELYLSSLKKYCELAEQSWGDEYLDWIGNSGQEKYYPVWCSQSVGNVCWYEKTQNKKHCNLPHFNNADSISDAIHTIGNEGLKLILGVM